MSNRYINSFVPKICKPKLVELSKKVDSELDMNNAEQSTDKLFRWKIGKLFFFSKN